MKFVLDTNIISELRKPQPHSKVLNWLAQNEISCALSQITIGELLKGAYALQPGRRQDETIQWIGDVEQEFAGRLLPFDLSAVHEWGEMCGIRQRQGQRLPVLDSLIAATARQNRLVLVTRNIAAFEGLVDVLNPWN